LALINDFFDVVDVTKIFFKLFKLEVGVNRHTVLLEGGAGLAGKLPSILLLDRYGTRFTTHKKNVILGMFLPSSINVLRRLP
jgi:hypothetical protein